MLIGAPSALARARSCDTGAGGGSAAINLRNDHEASLISTSPPPPEKVKAQGSAIFKNNVTPAIDPANYAEQ